MTAPTDDQENLSPDPIDRCVLQMFAAYDSDPVPPMREIRNMAIACVKMLSAIYNEKSERGWDYRDYLSPDEWLDWIIREHEQRETDDREA